jgi:GNAT superfamily N-acetyltransferase
MLSLRLATLLDREQLMDLYRGAQQWLAERGLPQWQPRPGDEGPFLSRVRAKFADAIEADTCYLVLVDGELAGTITLDEYADPDFWGPDDDPRDALYVHRMIIDRRYAGQKVGAEVLDWAAGEAARQGKKWLRLDAWQTNGELHGYYRRQGFEHVRTLNYTHRPSGALFQRATGLIR